MSHANSFIFLCLPGLREAFESPRSRVPSQYTLILADRASLGTAAQQPGDPVEDFGVRHI